MVSPRSILKFFLATEQAEGVGARVRRSIGTGSMRNFSPFLMLDHFNIDPAAGFPDHPHRGQETITYITQGQVAHEDFTGSAGVLGPGDLQFMTAGRGVVHAEMPVKQLDGKNTVGMQLWVDLPENLKACEPRYRDLKAKEIPIAKPNDKVEVKVISGESYGVTSVQDLAYTPVSYYHYTVQPGGNFIQPFPEDFNCFLYMMQGSISVNGTRVPQYNNVFFKRDGDVVEGANDSNETAEFVLVGGKMLDQKIVQYGPFVETSTEKISKALSDYRSGANGFERARNWQSKIVNGAPPQE